MQKINKMASFNYYRMSFFYKLVTVFFSSLTIFIFLSGFNVFPLNLTEIFFKKNKRIQYIDSKKFYSEKRINEYIDYSISMRYKHKIHRGDQISFLLNKSGVSIHDILKLIKSDPSLNILKIDQNISWKVSRLGELLELTWKISPLQKKVYKKIYNQFLISEIHSKNILIRKTIFIKKDSNFFQSALQSGLKKSEISDIIKAIEWQVDFYKLHIGSYFDFVFLHNLLDDAKNKNTLLGVKLNNSGKKYYAIRAFNGNFYDENGTSQKTMSINCLYLKKYRISSKFNLHRLNPVTHRITHHLGIDLAMRQGTPVLATSNGKVIKANFNNIAGLYVALKGTNEYTTRYMHLKKILVKLGDQVKIGQKIALSGNTGRTTGPHLHYEIWINDHAVDPISSKFMSFNELTKKQKITYLKDSKQILQLLQ